LTSKLLLRKREHLWNERKEGLEVSLFNLYKEDLGRVKDKCHQH
jgi:hypothetical protein